MLYFNVCIQCPRLRLAGSSGYDASYFSPTCDWSLGTWSIRAMPFIEYAGTRCASPRQLLSLSRTVYIVCERGIVNSQITPAFKFARREYSRILQSWAAK